MESDGAEDSGSSKPSCITFTASLPHRPKKLISVTPRQFGAIGDCLADDTEPFRKMHDYLRRIQDEDAPDTVAFRIASPANMCYLLGKANQVYANRWLWGLKRVSVDLGGSAIRNVSNAAYALDRYPFLSNRPIFDRTAYLNVSHLPKDQFGYLISSALSGDGTLALTEPENITDFSIGDWVVVYSMAQTFINASPPHARQWDFARVAGLDRQLGRITLDRPVTYDHKSDFPEAEKCNPCVGRARVARMNGSDEPLQEYLKLKNTVILDNPNLPASSQYTLFAGTAIVAAENLSMNVVVVQGTTQAAFQNVFFTDSDIDTMNENIVIADSTLGKLNGLAREWRLLRNVFLQQANPVGNLVIYDSCEFRNSQTPGDFKMGMQIAPNFNSTIIVANSSFYGKDQGAPYTSLPISGGSVANDRVRVTLDPAAISIIDNSTITAPLSNLTWSQFVACVEPGSVIHTVRPSGPTPPPWGMVKNIASSSGIGTAQISFQWSGAVGYGDMLECIGPRNLIAHNNSYVNYRFSDKNTVSNGRSYHAGDFWGIVDFASDDYSATPIANQQVRYRWRISTGTFGSYIFSPNGEIQSVSINVTKPFTGTDPAYMIYRSITPYDNIIEKINLKTGGRRIMDKQSVAGGSIGDTLVIIPENSWTDKSAWSFAVAPSGGAEPSTTRADQEATLDLEIVVKRPAAFFPN